MTPDQALALIKARLEAATPGPWEGRVDDLTDDVDVLHDQEHVYFVAACGKKDQLRALEDAEFIANAPTDIARLLGAIEAVMALADTAPKMQNMGGWSPGILTASEIRAALSEALGKEQQ